MMNSTDARTLASQALRLVPRRMFAAAAAALALVALPAAGAAARPQIDQPGTASRSASALLSSGGRSLSRSAVNAANTTYPVSPLVGRRVQRFVLSRSDFSRSTLLGWIVVPLVLAVLIEAELLAVAGRWEARKLRAFGWPLIAVFAMLVLVRLRAYAG
jgi:hypothetical protein